MALMYVDQRVQDRSRPFYTIMEDWGKPSVEIWPAHAALGKAPGDDSTHRPP
jgi:hypothetical protein